MKAPTIFSLTHRRYRHGSLFIVIGSFTSFTLFAVSISGDLRINNSIDHHALHGHIDSNKYLPSSSSRHEKDVIETLQTFTEIENRYKRGSPAHYTFFTNWLMRLAGFVHPSALIIFDPDQLDAYASETVCSQSSFSFITALKSKNIRARQVGLYGHVVSEVWIDEAWHMFDPYSCYSDYHKSLLPSVHEISNNIGQYTHLYEGPNKDLILLFSSDRPRQYPPEWMYHNWKAQLLFRVDQIAFYAKYIIPALLFAVTFALAMARFKKPRSTVGECI